jgi:FAD dependent oxidoreductase TIGR03364
LRVVVIEREARAVGASIRNFGFVTVTGQEAGVTWARARRSAAVWREVAPVARIPVLHEGLVLSAHSPEAMAVIEAFRATAMGAACEALGPATALARFPALRADALEGALWSPHELRIEPRTALARLAAWLAEAHGVAFRWRTQAHEVAPPRIVTSGGTIAAGACVVCPGEDFLTLRPERIAAYGLTRCKLHMLRVVPGNRTFRLGAAMMSDTSLVRYAGYAALPEAAALRARLEAEIPGTLGHGIHLIVVQSADGSLVVGDSHHYSASPDPFYADEVEALILAELDRTLGLPRRHVGERWIGVYPSAPDRPMLVDAPEPAVRIVIVTGGTGMSTAFAIGEEVVGELLDRGIAT